ncbi:hypothetical protein GCM10010452_31420 [Crossiella cryophila]|uniref:Uncharacterized protein n=1 Tax=Crossiella cryophila TaxID=43355 RepID=A0A7W7C3R4_9PSEU|nr:hypothetical protein [Crossiella cryophila]
MAVCADGVLRTSVLAVVLLGAGCAAPPEAPKPDPAPVPIDVAIGGKRLSGGQHLQAAAEASITRALAQQKVARSGDGSVHCWFAKVDPNTQTQQGRAVNVTDTLWCGPVQVPGTGPAPDWIPVPLTQQNGQFAVGEPKLPEPGTSSTPSTEMVRVDGTEAKPSGSEQRSAGPGFFAVVADTGGKTNGDLGLIPADAIKVRDDFLSIKATGWGNPQQFTLPDGGVLSPEPGSRLAVLRLHSDRISQLDQELTELSWARGAPPRPELALDLPDGWHDVPDSQLPTFGGFFLVFTLPAKDTGQAPAKLVLRSKPSPGVEQQIELPSGKSSYPLPEALRRAGYGAAPTTAGQDLTFQHKGSSGTARLTVQGVRLGLQRPVLDSAGRLQVITADPGKALLEIRVRGEGSLPEALGGPLTGEHIVVKLPNGSKAPLKGLRYGGDVFPTALVVEVPANVPSVTVSLSTGTVTLPSRGSFSFSAASPAMTLSLDF